LVIQVAPPLGLFVGKADVAGGIAGSLKACVQCT
jgi:hypothetical protein